MPFWLLGRDGSQHFGPAEEFERLAEQATVVGRVLRQ
jgi:hypothetical protein